MNYYFDANELYEAGRKAICSSSWKYQTQLFEINRLMETAKTQNALRSGKYRPKPGVKFLANERGRKRYITSATMADKMVNHVTCDRYLTPLLGKYLQYDNSASQRGKGVAFHRRRFEIQLRKYYEREETNEGYIMLSDLSGYYANILHEIALKLIEASLRREISNREELDFLMRHLRLKFKMFEQDVSRFSDKEIAKMYHEKVSPLLNYGIPKELLAGTKMLRKGMELGDQVPQNVGVFLPVPMDNYVKIVCGVKYYGRYSDDFRFIDPSKERLKEIMDGIREQAKELGLIINEHKTRICKLSGWYRHLQVCYSLRADGKIIKKINPKSITRERRKLKAYKRLLSSGKMTYQEIENCFKSWLCGCYKYMSRRQIQGMNNLFQELFGKEIKWKKGHGRLRWLMAPSCPASGSTGTTSSRRRK